MAVDVHFMKACGTAGNTVTLILTSALNSCEWSASRPSRLTPERYPLHRKLASVGPTAGPRALEKADKLRVNVTLRRVRETSVAVEKQ